jgi:hypothetical protein
MKLAKQVLSLISEHLLRAEMQKAKAELSKKELVVKANTIWDEGVHLAKEGKYWPARLEFEDAVELSPTQSGKKEMSKWLSAAKLATEGKPEKIKELLEKLKG